MRINEKYLPTRNQLVTWLITGLVTVTAWFLMSFARNVSLDRIQLNETENRSLLNESHNKATDEKVEGIDQKLDDIILLLIEIKND